MHGKMQRKNATKKKCNVKIQQKMQLKEQRQNSM